MKKNVPQEYYNTYQLKLPLEISTIIDVTDEIYSLCEVLDHVDLNKYLTNGERRTGRPRYDEEALLRIILFAFMEDGYVSTRKIEKFCKTDIRYMWLLNDNPPPCHMTIANFMNNVLKESIEQIFADINGYIFEEKSVDTNHCYIDGTKIETNANKYSWVGKKSCQRNIRKIFPKVTDVLSEMNEIIAVYRVKFDVREEYAVEYLEELLQHFVKLCNLDTDTIKRGRGHRKSPELRLYDSLWGYIKRLKNIQSIFVSALKNETAIQKLTTMQLLCE